MTKHFVIPYKYHLISIFAICVLSIIIYSNTLHSPFVFDDLHGITDNRDIRLTGLSFQRLFDLGFERRSNRPVAHISFALNYYFGGYNVIGYHVVNIAIHLINGFLVYLLALTTFSRFFLFSTQTSDHANREQILLMAMFTALIFVAHPLQTQSITYIVQRMTSMSVMFCLLSLFLYTRGRISRTGWRRWTLFISCLLSWIIALGCKQIAVTLPLIVLLYEWYFFQDLSTVWLKNNIKYFLVPICILCLIVFIYLGSNNIERILAAYKQQDYTILERVLTQFRVVTFYISLLLYPHPSRLNLDHHFTLSHSLVEPTTTFLSLLIILGLIGLALYLARRNRLISFGILWFLINLVLESSAFWLAMIFEHRLYFPMFGFALIIAYLIFHFLLRKQLWAVIISSILVLSLGTATLLRNRVWHDHIALWSDVLSKNPQSHRAYNNLGLALAAQGKFNEAIGHYMKASQIKPELAPEFNYTKLHNNWGVALMSQGKLKEAIAHYKEAMKINPRFADTHNNLGLALAAQTKLNEAIGQYAEALRLDPDHVDARCNLGNTFAAQGKLNEAIGHYTEALRINPFHAMAHNNLGSVLARQGEVNDAIDHFSEALKINPVDSKAHCNLGIALMSQKRTTEAIGHFLESLRINPGYAKATTNLKNALALQGHTTNDR